MWSILQNGYLHDTLQPTELVLVSTSKEGPVWINLKLRKNFIRRVSEAGWQAVFHLIYIGIIEKRETKQRISEHFGNPNRVN